MDFRVSLFVENFLLYFASKRAIIQTSDRKMLTKVNGLEQSVWGTVLFFVLKTRIK